MPSLLSGAFAQRVDRDRCWRGRVADHGDTSFVASICDCSISCCFMASIHQAKSEFLSCGVARLGRNMRTISIGCLVNFEIAALAFSRSLLTIVAASSIAARKALMAPGF